MDEKTREIAERFLWKLPAISTIVIAEILGVDQKEIILLRREIIERGRLAYCRRDIGVILEREAREQK